MPNTDASPTTQIARRSTFDGKHVLLWSDGSLTWALGYAIKGSAFPKTTEQRIRAIAAGWLVLGEVEAHDAADVSALVTAARRAVAKNLGAIPGDVRDEMAKARARAEAAAMPGYWSVMETDPRDNKTPTCRLWKFPRVGPFARFAIWHERGKYEVMLITAGKSPYGHRTIDDVLESTGYESPTLGEAFANVRSMVVA